MEGLLTKDNSIIYILKQNGVDYENYRAHPLFDTQNRDNDK